MLCTNIIFLFLHPQHDYRSHGSDIEWVVDPKKDDQYLGVYCGRRAAEVAITALSISLIKTC